ncbi:hypothetical protein CDAR_483481 [Caerostris darwini]|uniref:Uncharacterized protein n=1 Tax=Caerostris darwini TaxID=1538125 RepID=A0AAV4VDT2_9ARAC|nr:hypothetical protein CDAR_483481 [Caerostris darwini]
MSEPCLCACPEWMKRLSRWCLHLDMLLRHSWDWPLFNSLLPMANRLRGFMSKQDLERLLGSLAIRRAQHGCPGFIYEELITEIWYQSPAVLKEGITRKY